MNDIADQIKNKKTDKWSLLSPLSVIHFITKFISQIIKHSTQSLAPLAGVLVIGGDNRWQILTFIGLAFLAIMIIAGFLSYIKFRFRLDGDRVLIRSGVLNQKNITLTFDRIQNVILKEPIYFRPFNLVTMEIESTGSSNIEISLGGIPRLLAEAIRLKVIDQKHIKIDHESEEETSPIKEDQLIHRPISELVRYGLSSNAIWAFAALAASILPQLDFEEWGIFEKAGDFITNTFGSDPVILSILSFVGIVFIIAALLLISVLGSIIIYYDFRLSKHGKRFQATKGLFEKQENTMLESKIQSIKIKQPWVAKLFGRSHIHLKKTGSSTSPEEAPAGGGQKFIIPSVEHTFTDRFTKILYPSFNWQSLPLKGIHYKFVTKYIFMIFLPIAALISTVITLISGSYFGLLPLLLPLLATPIIMLIRARYGYASDDEHGIVRTGFFGQTFTIFPFFKAQTVTLTQTPGQRKHKLATLDIKLSGDKIHLPYIPFEDASNWRDKILYKIESVNKPWM